MTNAIQIIVSVVNKATAEFKKISAAAKNFTANMQTLRLAMGVYNKSVEKAQNSMKSFRGDLLSLLFFGMAIKRLFQGMLVSTLKFFRETTESQTITGQALTRLIAGWQFLKFTIGNAIATVLAPLVPKILSIIEAITDWIDKNPKLAGWIVIIGLALGTLLMVVGMLGLGIAGVVNFIKLSVIPIFKALAFVVAAVGWPILLIIAAVALLAVAWATNFGGIREKTASFFKFLMKVWNGGGRWVFLSIIKLLQTLWLMFKTALGNIGDIWIIVWNSMLGGVQWVWNQIVNAIAGAINVVIGLIRKLVRQLNKIPKVNIPMPDFVNWDGALANTEEHAKKIEDAAKRMAIRTGTNVMQMVDTWSSGWKGFGKVSQEAIDATAEKIENFEIPGTEGLKSLEDKFLKIGMGENAGGTTTTTTTNIENVNIDGGVNDPNQIWEDLQGLIEQQSGGNQQNP